MSSSSTVSRRAYIDWARGIAVLLMIGAHTSDAWTRTLDKQTLAYGYVTLFGGFAAPLFLWLAGVGLALSASRTFARTDSVAATVDASCRRGLEIFLLAFLFRLQAFVLSPGGPPIAIFRVDVLNVMGLALAAAGLLWALSQRTMTRTAMYASVALAIAMVTPVVRASASVDALPTWFQWYLRPAGEHTTFTLLPWSGFVFAGAAVGSVLAAARGEQREHRALAGIGIAGAALVAGGLWAASRPTIYHVPSSFWTSSPTWFGIRVGVVMIALSALSMFRDGRGIMNAWQKPLTVMGRASLFIYWIHVELVYGYVSWLWRHRLPLWGTAFGFVALTVLMYAAVLARDRYLARKPIGISEPITVPQA